MALQTPYLAAENSRAARRSRALHRSIVATPVLLLIAVGLVGHVHPRRYAHPVGTADYDRRVLAYRDRVVAVESRVVGDVEPSASMLSAEGRRWTSGFATGRLTAIEPAVYEDHLRDGPRGEILRAGLALSAALEKSAESDLQRGDLGASAQNALLGAEVAHGLRGFEFQSFLQGLLAMRRNLGVLLKAWPAVSAGERKVLRPRVLRLMVDPNEVGDFLKVDKEEFDDFRHRQKISFDELVERNDAVTNASGRAAADRSLRSSNARVQALLSS